MKYARPRENAMEVMEAMVTVRLVVKLQTERKTRSNPKRR